MLRRGWTGRGTKRLHDLYPGPYAPPPIAGYTSWYDADDLASMTLDTGGRVTQWNDKSGNGNHLTATVKPHVVRFVNGYLNNRSAVSFNTASAAGAVMSSAQSTSDTSSSAFVVAMTQLFSQLPTLVGPNADGGNQFRISAAGLLETNRADQAAIASLSTPAVTLGVPFVAGQLVETTQVTQYLNAASPETDVVAPNLTAARTLSVGISPTVFAGGGPLHGFMLEMIFYPTTLSGGDAVTTIAHLMNKWAIS